MFGPALLPTVGCSRPKRRVEKKVLAGSIRAPQPIGTPKLKSLWKSLNAQPKRLNVKESKLESKFKRVSQESVKPG
jgi:hypothetical protein